MKYITLETNAGNVDIFIPHITAVLDGGRRRVDTSSAKVCLVGGLELHIPNKTRQQVTEMVRLAR